MEEYKRYPIMINIEKDDIVECLDYGDIQIYRLIDFVDIGMENGSKAYGTLAVVSHLGYKVKNNSDRDGYCYTHKAFEVLNFFLEGHFIPFHTNLKEEAHKQAIDLIHIYLNNKGKYVEKCN
jgi:hypothetical protein